MFEEESNGTSVESDDGEPIVTPFSAAVPTLIAVESVLSIVEVGLLPSVLTVDTAVVVSLNWIAVLDSLEKG